jgi:ankyrin repeat protein
MRCCWIIYDCVFCEVWQGDCAVVKIQGNFFQRSVDCLDLLVSSGANFQLQDAQCRTPLHYAAAHCQYPCVFTLVGIGSHVNKQDVDGCTPLHQAAAQDLDGK